MSELVEGKLNHIGDNFSAYAILKSGEPVGRLVLKDKDDVVVAWLHITGTDLEKGVGRSENFAVEFAANGLHKLPESNYDTTMNIHEIKKALTGYSVTWKKSLNDAGYSFYRTL